MRIHPATTLDADRLVALNRHVHDIHVSAEPHVYRATTTRELEAHYAELLSRPNVTMFLALEDATAVGYASTTVVDQAGHTFAHPHRTLLVDQLAVAPEARHRGIGRALMNAAPLPAELELPVAGKIAGARVRRTPPSRELNANGDQRMTDLGRDRHPRRNASDLRRTLPVRRGALLQEGLNQTEGCCATGLGFCVHGLKIALNKVFSSQTRRPKAPLRRHFAPQSSSMAQRDAKAHFRRQTRRSIEAPRT